MDDNACLSCSDNEGAERDSEGRGGGETDTSLPRSRKDERNMSKEERQAVRAQRKMIAKEQKKNRHLQGRKPCERCSKPECEVLIRCQCKEWEGWKLVCGKCWRDVSGGVPDGDLEHRDYRYGGLWRFRKNAKDDLIDSALPKP